MMEVRMFHKGFLSLVILTGFGLLASCNTSQTTPTPDANLPNPASVYCEQNGGKLEFRQDASGGVAGICIFPDGSECDEWAYYRGECKPGGEGLAPKDLISPMNLSAQDAGSTIRLKVGQILDITLEGNPTTGYSWEVAPVSENLLAQQGEWEFTPDSNALGSGGTVTLRFKAVQSGNAELKLIYHRTFEPEEQPIQTFRINLVVGE